MANATEYGLANAVMSSDADQCSRVASKLKSGVVLPPSPPVSARMAISCLPFLHVLFLFLPLLGTDASNSC